MNFNKAYLDNDPSLPLIESGYARLINTISGLAKNIRSFGILTWENPGKDSGWNELISGKNWEQINAFNNKRNHKLRRRLDAFNYGYYQIKGRFLEPSKETEIKSLSPTNPRFQKEGREHPIFVPNITKKDILQLGEEGGQISVIWGEVPNPNEIIFYYMDCETGNIEAERKVWTQMEKGQLNYYSEIKGKQFQIPFFDDQFKNAYFEKGTIKNEI